MGVVMPLRRNSSRRIFVLMLKAVYHNVRPDLHIVPNTDVTQPVRRSLKDALVIDSRVATDEDAFGICHVYHYAFLRR
jgi:hypothetical protein